MIRLAVSAAVIAASGAAANAAMTELQFDWNSVTAQSKDAAGVDSAFGGLSHTGSIVFSDDANSGLLLTEDFSGFPTNTYINTGSNPAVNLMGEIELVNGIVVGGFFAVEANGDTYDAQIRANSGAVSAKANGFTLDGLTFNGTFSDDNFDGIDVTNFFDFNGQNPGSFLQILFNPNASGQDVSGDLEITATVIPMPLPAAMATVGLAAVATRRRR